MATTCKSRSIRIVATKVINDRESNHEKNHVEQELGDTLGDRIFSYFERASEISPCLHLYLTNSPGVINFYDP
jgi:hypothetical protein